MFLETSIKVQQVISLNTYLEMTHNSINLKAVFLNCWVVIHKWVLGHPCVEYTVNVNTGLSSPPARLSHVTRFLCVYFK